MSMVSASTTLVPSSSTHGLAITSDLRRHLADYHPSLWNDYFLQYASESLEVDEEMGKQVETVKEEVRKMLISPMEKPFITKLELIDSIQRLGLSYHFEHEIDGLLHQIHNAYVEDNQILTHTEDLNSLALLFKLLRQQGYPISPDVFNKFKDDEGNFSEKMASDIQGMLSLYEAAYLSVHGEDILDEALVFTWNRLRSITVESNLFLAEKLQQSLKQCPYRGLPRLEARKYISIYHLHPSCDQVLLMLAKLDFNMLQKLHQKEFGNICKWWNKLDVPRNVSYARNRIVGLCFWVLTVYFEPQYSKARRMMTKVIGLLSIIDDTYDAYGTIDELELLTEAIQRWDICCLNDLPEYIKLVYKEVLNVFQEIDEDMRKEGRSYSVPYAKHEFKKAVRAYMTEARWLNKNHVPTTEEYINVSTVTTCYPALSTTSFLGMGNIASEDIFKWAQTHPKVVKASPVICRLMDDIVSSEFEKRRGHVASLTECYMKEHGVSKEDAIDELEKMIRSAWKDVDQECLRPTQVAKPILMRVLNLARFMDVIYKDADNFTHSAGIMKDSIQLVILDPVPI
ncbi:(-)-germacrene D synthase-like [Prosopis cineraria]|uniref:(-)-germacrene D synthase-like n=1 Tax=Prosopis cineraria TaxID=364024 RepID=UPI00240F74B3|nr:(-)-germacrene D synthase-like [Prosopis cineraria]